MSSGIRCGHAPRVASSGVVLPLLVFLFIVVPIAELYVIIQVGQAIGVLPTIALLILDSVLGSMLLRHQGRAACAASTRRSPTVGRPAARWPTARWSCSAARCC